MVRLVKLRPAVASLARIEWRDDMPPYRLREVAQEADRIADNYEGEAGRFRRIAQRLRDLATHKEKEAK